MIATVTLLALRRAAGLPRWLGLFGAVVVLEQALETATVFGHSGSTAPGGPMNMQDRRTRPSHGDRALTAWQRADAGGLAAWVQMNCSHLR